MIKREHAALAFLIIHLSRWIIEQMTVDLEYTYLDVHGENERREGDNMRLDDIRRSLESVRDLLEKLDKLESEAA